MKVQEIKDIALGMGLKPGRMKKLDLVRSIQRHEGHNDCFGTNRVAHCNEMTCLWRADCLIEAKSA
ncbi:MAG: SAP domain-containing protein [Gammaproteobacteria bacterium]|nr:SAP domain-containing protein [Gammaproteobacteria bacterium]MBU1655875.1 SAP domain-containing protein [Gammaproteobacteria bacterium]MBU1960618.1 SAP domain-containing protein [Gammaproteobacteria bacterium]